MMTRLMVLKMCSYSTLCQSPNNRLQRTGMDKVPKHEGRRAAAALYGTKNWDEVHFPEIKWLFSEHLGK